MAKLFMLRLFCIFIYETVTEGSHRLNYLSNLSDEGQPNLIQL